MTRQLRSPALDPHAVPARAGDVSYATHVKPIFEQLCTDCHRPGNASGGLDLTSREAVARGSDSGGRLLGGPLAENVIWDRVASPDPDYWMPKGNRLTDAQLGTDAVDPRGEARVVVQARRAGARLARQQLTDRARDGLGLLDEQPQRSAVNRELHDVVHHDGDALVQHGPREHAGGGRACCQQGQQARPGAHAPMHYSPVSPHALTVRIMKLPWRVETLREAAR